MAGKKNIYVVGYGVDPSTKEPVIGKQFKNWNECKPYIDNVPNAKYKGFYTQEEADVWMQKIKDKLFNNNGNNGNKPPIVTGHSPEGGAPDPEPFNDTGTTGINQNFLSVCNSRGYDPLKVLDMLKLMFIQNISLTDKYLAPTHMPTQEDVDMELPFRF